ncbi:MAG: hypothetical protein LBH43_06195 [Treponema sp.]|jgi:hypothetical protein|nr:hypothetical protein [Treponema sp.]
MEKTFGGFAGTAPLRKCRLLTLLPFVTFISCIGVKADISLKADGSGRLALEYRVSGMAESLGRLDGNQRWQTVPVGRADFERTLARLPRLRLSSFSSSKDGKDVINKAVLEFKEIEDLLAFFDPQGQGKYASFTRENGKKRLSLVFSEGGEADADLLSLVREVSEGYAFSFSMGLPESAELALTDGKGKKITPQPSSATVVSPGKKVSFSIGTGDLLSLKEGLGIELCW